MNTKDLVRRVQRALGNLGLVTETPPGSTPADRAYLLLGALEAITVRLKVSVMSQVTPELAMRQGFDPTIRDIICKDGEMDFLTSAVISERLSGCIAVNSYDAPHGEDSLEATVQMLLIAAGSLVSIKMLGNLDGMPIEVGDDLISPDREGAISETRRLVVRALRNLGTESAGDAFGGR